MRWWEINEPREVKERSYRRESLNPDIALRGASGVTTEVAEVFIIKEVTNDFSDFVK